MNSMLLVEDHIEIMLRDLMLPDGNRYEFCSRIRERVNEIPIIFMTNYCEESNVIKSREYKWMSKVVK